MTKKYILLISLIIFALFIQIVAADLIITGTKQISWCYEIPNIGDYQNYIFVYNDQTLSQHGIINSDDCFSFYKYGLTSVYAIKKTEFNQKELNQDFFSENNSKLIKANLVLNAYGIVQENDPLQKAIITLKIISLNEDKLEIQKSKITYTYTDGTSEEKYFQTQEIIPKPSKTTILPWWFAKFWYVIIPLMAAMLIGIIIFLKRLKK